MGGAIDPLASSPRGCTLKFSVYIGEADFFGVKILNFRILGGGGFRKTSYFLG